MQIHSHMPIEYVSGNIFIRRMHFAKVGDVCPGHEHNFDHTSILFRGAVRIVRRAPEGHETIADAAAPAHFLIQANCLHEITALEDDTEIWCVFAHRDQRGDVVQDHRDGWSGAYDLRSGSHQSRVFHHFAHCPGVPSADYRRW